MTEGYLPHCRYEDMSLVMNNMCRFLLLSLALFAALPDVLAWGQKGHDVTCTVAYRHLGRKAKKEINRLLEGKSIVYWCNWLDNASHTPEYAYSKTWHYRNVDAGVAYEDAVAEPKGDVVTAIRRQIQLLSDKSTSVAERRLALKMLVHLVGDLHQPMHMGHKTDLGGNLWPVVYFGQETNLHSVWDSSVLESGHRWSNTEWADEIDRLDKAAIREVCRGSIDDWARETLKLTADVYAGTPQNALLSYDYVAEWTPYVERQLLFGGLRLAYLLNQIL